MRYAPNIIRDEFRLHQQYLSGLNPHFAQIIDISGVNRLPDLILRATTAESYDAHISQSGGFWNVQPRVKENSRPSLSQDNLGDTRINTQPNQRVMCNHCGRPHASNQCSIFHKLCHRCLKPRHFARECPTQNVNPNKALDRGYVRPPAPNVNATIHAPLARGLGNNFNNKRKPGR